MQSSNNIQPSKQHNWNLQGTMNVFSRTAFSLGTWNSSEYLEIQPEHVQIVNVA